MSAARKTQSPWPSARDNGAHGRTLGAGGEVTVAGFVKQAHVREPRHKESASACRRADNTHPCSLTAPAMRVVERSTGKEAMMAINVRKCWEDIDASQMPWLARRIEKPLRQRVNYAFSAPLPGLEQRFQSAIHDVNAQLCEALTQTPEKEMTWKGMLATLERTIAYIGSFVRHSPSDNTSARMRKVPCGLHFFRTALLYRDSRIQFVVSAAWLSINHGRE